MTPPALGKPRPSWLYPTLLWAAAVIAAVGIGLYATPPEIPLPPGAKMGRSLPRLPGPPPNFRTLLYLLGVGSVVWYAAMVALPFLVWGARRVDFERHGRGRSIGVAVLVVLSLIAVTSFAQFFAIYHGAPLRPGFAAYLPQALRQNVLPWVALAGIVTAVEARRRAVRSALDHERLRTQVAEQRLIALTGQLHPHFLFNTLQGISTLIHRDPEAADEMLAKLSDLLRTGMLSPVYHGECGLRTLRELARSFGERVYCELATRSPSEFAVAEKVFRLQCRKRGADCIFRGLVGAKERVQLSNSVRVGVPRVRLAVSVFQKLRRGLLQQRAHVLQQPLPFG